MEICLNFPIHTLFTAVFSGIFELSDNESFLGASGASGGISGGVEVLGAGAFGSWAGGVGIAST